jgi:alkylated DNA repair protein alkB family protein 1
MVSFPFVLYNVCIKIGYKIGVPLIIEDSLPEYLVNDDDDDDWKLYGEFMKTARINLNIRQVNAMNS